MGPEVSHSRTESLEIGDSVGPKERLGIYQWYALSLLVALQVINMVDRSVISVVVEPLKAAFSLSDKQVGMLAVAFAVTNGLASLPMGWLADRVNRRAMLSAAVVTWSGLTAACSFAPNFAMLILARMGVGISEAPTVSASLSLIADTFPVSRRNTALSLFSSGVNIGQVVIFIVGGWLLMHYGWRTVFLVAGAPGLPLALLIYFTTREPKRGAFDARQHTPKEETAPVGGALRNIFGNPALLYAIVALTTATGVVYSVSVWATSFLVRVHGLSVSEGAIRTGLGYGICATVGSLLVGPLADRFSKGNLRKLTIIPMVFTFVALIGGVTMVLGGALAVSFAGLALMSLTTGFFVPISYSVMLLLCVPEQRGMTAATAMVFSTLVGAGPIPLITGAISDAIGGPQSIRPALLCTLAFLLFSIFCYVRVHRIVSRRERDNADSLNIAGKR